MLTPRTRCPWLLLLRSRVTSSFLFLFSVGKFSVNMSGDCTKYMFWQPWQLDGTSYQPLASFLGHYACLSFSHPSILVLFCKTKTHKEYVEQRKMVDKYNINLLCHNFPCFCLFYLHCYTNEMMNKPIYHSSFE